MLVLVPKIRIVKRDYKALFPNRDCQLTIILVHASACVHGDMKHAGSFESTKDA